MAAHSKERRVDALRRARDAQRAKLTREVDPDGVLAATDPAELNRRVAARVSAWYADLARASHAARRRNRIQREALAAAEIAAAAVLKAYAETGAA
ncbi:hypothetical protein ABZX66_20815 [Micromonospora aurantiaca]|uniref:hypothetical protein n=1 Tax=Micromonospora TaxID=1873 RepID=UPI00296E4EE6|nr:hypothetical protein [Micromonospora sp. BRA006-A]MDW3849680.1 hypothetical protein [Micromonospora sp. BRA006-A]